SGDDRGDGTAKGSDPARLHGSDTDNARALGNQPIFEIKRLHRVIDLIFRDENDIVEKLAAHGESETVVHADTAAKRVGEAGNFLDLDRASGTNGAVHRRAAIHRDANDLDPGLDLLGGKRN